MSQSLSVGTRFWNVIGWLNAHRSWNYVVEKGKERKESREYSIGMEWSMEWPGIVIGKKKLAK
jgi:hypothetical protein